LTSSRETRSLVRKCEPTNIPIDEAPASRYCQISASESWEAKTIPSHAQGFYQNAGSNGPPETSVVEVSQLLPIADFPSRVERSADKHILEQESDSDPDQCVIDIVRKPRVQLEEVHLPPHPNHKLPVTEICWIYKHPLTIIGSYSSKPFIRIGRTYKPTLS